ncbi:MULTISPECIES: bifunctional DNA primase/polymerase [Amycolatopsis]|uniref:Bifunctional DNA primase/polymerase, N-terminal n=1 Tax=Amycolatopsis tolypomycina TaxID=208445 RepID=A0A1H5DG33_9PSEU|nr:MULTISPECIES: bifunctional DNA primase/polymerase [Amycolatopsis]SED77903.1 Bifunctional DNA primase/polymerase, N-terminal [Amycolatopsis tolypomycina]HET6703403.1 bifunctional DNA primase/polymerase [Amycolatopsis sp.]
MLDANWPDSWRGAFRIELRAEAIGLAWRGWPVLPGVNPAPLAGGDDLTWRRPVPASDAWREQLGTHAHEVATWFSDRTHSLLVATGTVLDAIEVDDELGKRACRLLRAIGHPAPIIALPNGRWLFLTTVADRIPAELAERAAIQWHGKDSYIPLPPSPFQHGVVHWRVKPEVCGWQLPDAAEVHDVLVRALAGERAGQLVQTSAA